VQSANVFRQDSPARRVEFTRDPRDADARVLHHLHALGHNTRQELGGRHFIYLPTREGAHNVAQVLEREGWDTAVRAGEDVWLVVAGCLRVLTEPLVRETRSRLASLAAAHGGSYDGWEAQRT